MDERNVCKTWKCMCENNEDVFRVCMQVKELVDKCIDGVLNMGNAVKLLNVFVQSKVFTTEHAICIYFIFFISF